MDKLSKKLIKCMSSYSSGATFLNGDIYDLAEQCGSEYDFVYSALEFLSEAGYVAKENVGSETAFKLSHKSLHQKEFRRLDFVEYIKDNWVAILALAVSAVALIRTFFTT